MSTAQQFYDAFAVDYDHFVNWQERLKNEVPFLTDLLLRTRVHTVLDMAGATGQHAIALAKAGFAVSLADISPEMVHQAECNAVEAGITLPSYTAGFGQLSIFRATYDALLCLGNSVAHILDPDSLVRAISDMAVVVNRGGVLIWQLRNFERVLNLQERFMGPQAWHSAEHEHLFIRFYDFIPPQVRFNLIHLQRQGDGGWQQSIEQTVLHPWVLAELGQVFTVNGWENLRYYGNLRGDLYQPETSSDLVIVAMKS